MRNVFLPLALLTLLVAAVLRLWQLHLYPPGPHFDEAVNVIIIRSILYGGARYFPIVESYQGREVLYFYLNTPLFALLGDRVFTLHVTNAFCNLLTIAATIALGRAMFKGQRGLVVGLAAGVMIALSFPQIWLARQAFRAVTLPLCQSLALLFLWRGLNIRRADWIWLVPAGFFAGAALYTYNASRLFPLWLALGGLALLILDRTERRRRLRQGTIFFAVLAVTIAPMAVYGLQHPDIFLGRLEEVTRYGDEPVTLAESIWLHVRMFFIQGETYLRYNVPGRPYFTIIEGIFLLVGIVAVAVRLARSGRATERAACWLALLSPLMVIPSVVSVGGLPPNHMRSVGMVPLIFILAAVGFETLFRRLLAIEPRLSPRPVLTALTAITLLAGSWLVGSVYFAWAGRADLYYESNADLAAAARWLPSHVDGDTQVYVASRERDHPTMTIEPIPPVTWLGTDTLFLPPPAKQGLYIFPRTASPPSDWAEWLAPYRLEGLPLGPDGQTAFEVFRLSSETPLPPSDPLPQSVVRNPVMTLLGVQTPLMLPAGRDQIVLDWLVEQTPSVSDLTPIVQLEDSLGTVLHRSEAPLGDTRLWQPGEVLFHRMGLRIPLGTPPGRYPLRVAWVERSSQTYVSYLDEDSGQAGIWAQVGELEVIRPNAFPDPSELPIETRRVVEVAPGVLLLGWTMPQPQTVRPGETLSPTLFWQASPLEAPRSAIEVEALLRGSEETPLWVGMPVNNRYPSDGWIDGELVTDHTRWTVPREQSPGRYTLAVRVFSHVVDLGEIVVAGVPRQFEPPPVSEVSDVLLGDSLSLYGYDLNLGDDIQLNLVWQSLAPVSQDYTVFVHLVGEDGNLTAQHDTMPQNNAYPTSLWSAGEYVVDSYNFTNIPPGRYHIRVGLYLQSNGARLPVSLNGEMSGDFIEIGPIVISP